jgi:hypothetical protein
MASASLVNHKSHEIFFADITIDTCIEMTLGGGGPRGFITGASPPRGELPRACYGAEHTVQGDEDVNARIEGYVPDRDRAWGPTRVRSRRPAKWEPEEPRTRPEKQHGKELDAILANHEP